MITKARMKRIRRLEAFFDPIAAQLRPEPVYWVEGADEGVDYCRACAERAVADLNSPDVTIGGGYDDRRYCDSPAHCYTCGKTLGYWLTDWGFRNEVYEWEETLPGNSHPETAYAITTMLAAIGERTDKSLIDRALKVAEDVAKHVEAGRAALAAHNA